METRLLAARRIGELVPAEQGKRTDKELVQPSDKLEVPKQRLSEFRYPQRLMMGRDMGQ